MSKRESLEVKMITDGEREKAKGNREKTSFAHETHETSSLKTLS